VAIRARWRGFELPTTIAADQETLTASYGKFTAEPFERGFGTTIGNSLRRVLLSSLEGAAATSVKVDGALHEFSSLPGVMEDVTDIVLNVKKLLVRVRSDEPQTLVLDVKKKGVVTAGELDGHPLVHIVNPDLHLAELSEETSLRMEIQVRKGRGYVTAEENDTEDREIGIIPIDSIFSPVHRIRYRTENTRVGQLTDYDKLILEIWTDGTVHPERALTEAGKILRKHLIPFVNYGTLGPVLPGAEAPAVPEPEAAPPPEPGAELAEEELKKSVRDLDLSVRASNALEGNGIDTLGNLIERTEPDLLKLRNFGATTLTEVKTRLEALGLRLGMREPAGVS